ncbi:uncharacterized protein LOC110706641 isoform X2 [Chenopodium quinoa]|uniref:uncharacterized protein LOC110706641 isoform X2 n=1 Tax=Chenopodium quinoa TaxID=63459 RepID=UPI000B78A249|nr:uncharacterized protein LOC110706641 isoform X2 [Chenopodium quinoa]
MNMSSFVSTKPPTCINLHNISLNSNIRKSSISSKSRFHYNLSSVRQSQRQRSLTVRSSIEPVPPPPTPSSPTPAGFPGRKGWIAGAVLALLLSFLKDKWGPLFLLRKEVDQRLQTVEDVAEGLEKLADKVEHMAEDIGEKLPEGSSLKRVATLIEDAAEKVELAAHLTDTAIDKIQELEDQVDSYAKSEKTKASQSIEENNTSNNSKPAS